MKLTPLISKEQIASKVQEAAQKIEHDYAGKDLVIIMVLKGALCFVSDLIREIHLPIELETLQCSSYGALGTQRGKLEVIGAERLNIHNRDVLLVDDIYDSGHTLLTLRDTLKVQKPRTLKTAVLLNKHGVEKRSEYRPDYVLFDIENLFVVGYGLDYKELYRGLPGIFIYTSSSSV